MPRKGFLKMMMIPRIVSTPPSSRPQSPKQHDSSARTSDKWSLSRSSISSGASELEDDPIHLDSEIIKQPLSPTFSAHQLTLTRDQSGGIFDLLVKFMEGVSVPQRALEFLEQSCAVKNAFQSFMSKSLDFSKTHRVPEEGFTTMVILTLVSGQSLSETSVKTGMEYIKSFLENGKISFFKDPTVQRKLPPDVDCTAVGLSVLVERNAIDASEIRLAANHIIGNTNEDGIIQVYFPPRGSRENRIDPTVCANALFFLNQIGRGAEAAKTEDYVYTVLETKEYLSGTRYYPSPDTFLYFVSRMLLASERLRDRFEPLLISRTQERMGQTENPLECAMRLIIAKQHGVANDTDFTTLVSLQNTEGAFPAAAFFQCGQHKSYFGSEAITSAFAYRGLTQETPESFIPKTELYYPFPVTDCGLDKERQLTQDLKQWYTEFNIFPEKARDTYTTLMAKYCRYCAPDQATQPQLLMAGKILSIFYAVNDTLADDPNHDQEFIRNLAGGMNGVWFMPQETETHKFPGLIKGARGFARELAQLGLPTQKITIDFGQSYTKFSEEVVKEASRFGDTAFSLSEFHDCRVQNLFLIQYVEFWNIINGNIFDDKLRETPYFNHILELAATVVYIANDIKSLARDETKGKPNYVIVLQRELGISRDAAIEKAHENHRDALIQFTETAKLGYYDPELIEHGSHTLNEFLKSSISGNIIAINECPFRYN